MTSTNSPAVFWNVGDSVGRDYAGGTADIPNGVPSFVVSTATTAPTAAPTSGLPIYLADTDTYVWDGSAWIGPYSIAT